MSLNEFLAWAVPEYERFAESNPNETPCVARFGDKGHYEIGNIEIISVAENNARQQHIAPARNTHGTLSSYRYCRCDRCREAMNRYYRERKRERRLTDKTPTF